MKKTIVFGSIIVCFLMLLVPNISAIESGNITENITDYNEKELIDAIKERIEELKVQNPNPKITFKNDSDGPFEGGLDDPFDWLDLFFGITIGYSLVKMFKNHLLIKAFLTSNIYIIVTQMISYGLYTWSTLYYLGDTFDIIDPDNDGY